MAATTPENTSDREESLALFIHGSNYIERAGSDFDYTQKICRQVFRGLAIPNEIQEGTAEYQEAKNALISSSLNSNPTSGDVNRSRLEVIQHAKAVDFALKYFVLDGKAFTEEFVLEIHRTLGSGNFTEDEGEPGRYRTWEVAARHDHKKKSIFIRHAAVPLYMANLARDLDEEVRRIDTNNEPIDAFDLASRYAHRFVNIHPFGDGNGRTCRIILNILLIKYAGYVSSFGSTEQERKEYLDIAIRGSKKFHKEDMEVEEADKTGHQELAQFTLKNSKHLPDDCLNCAETKESGDTDGEMGTIKST